jgi:4-hydroxy-3-polyprenylbenzoate decarboxylase
MLAACLYLGFGDDELECAGALFGEPLRVACCETAELYVPAEAEMVLEGVVDGRERIEEGPVSEYHGHYHEYGAGFGVEFLRMSSRSDAFFQVVLPGLFREHGLLGAVSIAAVLERHLRTLAPNLEGVAVPEAAAGRTAAVVALSEPRPGQARQLMMAAFAAVPLIKQVTVVDADVDPWSCEHVEWARMVRSRPERDLLVVPGARTDRSEPLSVNGVVAKLGIDATIRAEDRPTGPELARISTRTLEIAAALLETGGVATGSLPRTLGRSVGRVG